ncbi:MULTISPECIES: restriction endonuclease subunit S [Acinetobacter]|uniref:restriction endonuclease subunit S n=1 Tax=Acinetobacter TaxID=469 RepID=UPI0009493CBC|nr:MULTISPECIES: restriction endonuclease subunit S [Acinetobacter]APR70901.1 type I restriction endonuclease subunit R [Acinetobacter haemolyticus]WAU77372.1 restriction endonuclease subunit S [Acinetobacter sp. TR3]
MTIPVKKISTFCKTGSGGTPSRSNNAFFENGTIPWVKSGELKNRYITEVEEYITDLAVEKSSAKLVSKGSLLIAMYGATVGEVSQLTFDATTNQAICNIQPDENVCDVNYLYRFLEASKSYLLSRRVGGGQPNISQGVIKDLDVPLPPLAEQRRIASILDQADELRQKRQQAIEKLDQLLQATFIDMFGDPVSNPKGWDKLTIEKMLNNEKYSLKRGPFGGALKKEIFVESGYLVYEQYHALNNDFSFQRYFIDEDKYKELKAFNVKPKDIIVSCSGVNLGRLAEVPEGSPAGIINQALLKISLNQSIILNDIFIDIFMHPSFKKAFYGDFRGAAIPNFPPMSVFKEFEFIVPPLEIQKKYQSVKSQVKALQKNHQLADEMNLFSSLQNQAFNGTL